MSYRTKMTIRAIKVYSTKELAGLYNVCPRTLNKWMTPHREQIGQRFGRYYSVAQIQTIFDVLGMPKEIVDDI